MAIVQVNRVSWLFPIWLSVCSYLYREHPHQTQWNSEVGTQLTLTAIKQNCYGLHALPVTQPTQSKIWRAEWTVNYSAYTHKIMNCNNMQIQQKYSSTRISDSFSNLSDYYQTVFYHHPWPNPKHRLCDALDTEIHCLGIGNSWQPGRSLKPCLSQHLLKCRTT